MIDPKNITNFNRTEAELQEFLLFCVVVAGKNSHQQAKKLKAFLELGTGDSPFEKIRNMGSILNVWLNLQKVAMGQYDRISGVFWNVADWQDLSLKQLSDVEAIKGIGPKTARFFLMHSRPNQEIATLDTHILKWLTSIGVPNVPKATPSGKRYLKLEQVFLAACRARHKTPAELDLEIWKSLAKVNPAPAATPPEIVPDDFALHIARWENNTVMAGSPC
jgi:thermostable 8-oxoguanine DNA glycosylase